MMSTGMLEEGVFSIASGQQPMSLMTINANPKGRLMSPSNSSNNEDLLTIRILEASERKMQLIKKLLSPEEYNSIASELFHSGAEIRSPQAGGVAVKQVPTTPKTHRLSSVPTSVVHFDDNHYDERRRLKMSSKQLSKSEQDLKLTSTDLQENLAKKREAIDFFFHEPANNLNLHPSDNLAIELRSGYYLSGSSFAAATPERGEKKVIKNYRFSLTDRLIGLLGFIGISHTSASQGGEQDEFVKHHKELNIEPYTRERNLLAMKSRLEADGHLDKFFLTVDSEQHERFRCSNLVDLAKMHKDHTVGGALSFSTHQRSQAVKVVQPVGHFNKIHLVGPKQFDEAEWTTMGLLKYHPDVNWFLFKNERRQNLSKLMSSSNLEYSIQPVSGVSSSSSLNDNDDDSLRLDLATLRIKSHDLMLSEERVAAKLVESQRKMDKFRESFDRVSNKLVEAIEMYIRSPSDLPDLRRRIREAFEWRIESTKQLKTMKQEVLSIYNELDSLRKDQGFNSTAITIVTQKQSSQLPTTQSRGGISMTRDLVGKLIKTMSTKCQESQESEGGLSDFKRIIESAELQKYDEDTEVDDQLISPVEINKFGLEITPNDKCPQEEMQRRRAVENWMDSLKIRLLIGERHYYTCPSPDQLPADRFSLDLSKNQLRIPAACLLHIVEPTTELKLVVEVYTFGYKFLRINPKLIGSVNIKVATDYGATEHSVALQLLDGTTPPIEAQFEFNSSRCAQPGALPNRVANRRVNLPNPCKLDELVHLLYKKTFNICHKFDDNNTKISKLLNRIDTALLVQSISGLATSSSSYFALDPFVEQLSLAEGEKKNKGGWSARQALLIWRWTNNLSHLIHLSERENVKSYGLQVEEFKSKLQAISTGVKSKQPLLAGYRSIEQVRLWAVEYIREYERRLEEIIKFNAEQSRCQQSSTRVRDLLIEPKLTKIDLSGAVEIIRRLIPKPTGARRPLMPKRKAASRRQAATLMAISQQVDLDDSTARNTHDLESQVFAQWQRFANSMQRTIGNLQLVITVQQATNVPMRVSHHQQQRLQPSQTRSNSPFYSASPTSFLQVSQAASAQQLASASYYLSSPTTYVEIVFQRKQQASSLAQGKNPAWNETLFFPIDVSSSSASMRQRTTIGDDERSNRVHSQLVDEFLQLNLYDYHCYTPDSLGPMNEDGELSTLAMVSNTNERDFSSSIQQTNNSLIRANRVLASRQRIERHLLGSLKVPLTTLLSSGRIEGSFALNQPLFLDNYQFEQEPVFSSKTLLTGVGSAGAQQAAVAAGNHQKRTSQLETHISLFITLDPPVSIPFHHLYLPTGTHETERVFELARLWEQVVSQYRYNAVRASSPASHHLSAGTANRSLVKRIQRVQQNRHIKALVLQQDAKYCLISRLLAPIRPPLNDIITIDSGMSCDEMGQVRALARFVSLMSPIKYGLFNMRPLPSSVWFDSVQLVTKCLGGIEEKAVLLCNYFLYLGKCSAILLGDAVSEGRCVYVIVWHEQSNNLIIEDSQLQLQATRLLSSQQSTTISSQQLAGVPLIESKSFLSRMPILVNTKSVRLWDPQSGKSYSLDEPLQLVSVGSIVTMENVYANIQSIDSPNDTNFDIRSRNFWFPLFESSALTSSSVSSSTAAATTSGRGVNTFSGRRANEMGWRRQLARLEAMRRDIGRPLIVPIMANHPDSIVYEKKFEPKHCEELKGVIEKVIKAHLLKWRPDRPTYFNRTLSRLLADKLALFESYLLAESDKDRQSQQKRDWKSELADLIKNEVLAAHLALSVAGGHHSGHTRQVISWPVNLPYTTLKSILDSLFASGVHNADLVLDNFTTVMGKQLATTSSTQFLVACHVHPYPARVLSIWLYVAAVVTTNNKRQ